MTPQRIVHDVRQVMPPDGIVALDNGMYKIWFARNYRTDVANTLLLDNALATMGAGLPSGMMAALLYPKRRVLVVAGDGGFMMNSQELETARRMNLNLVVLIIEDHAYGMIRWKQAVDGFADLGLTFGNPDFVAYAAAYGARGRRVTTASGLAPALEEAFSAGGLQLSSFPSTTAKTSGCSSRNSGTCRIKPAMPSWCARPLPKPSRSCRSARKTPAKRTPWRPARPCRHQNS